MKSITMMAGAAVLALPSVSSAQSQSTQTTYDGQQRDRGSIQQAAGPVREIDLNEIEDEPAAYAGQRVTVQGEVQEVIGPRLFSMDEGSWSDLFDFDADTLVYVPSRIARLSDNDDIVVTGTVMAYADIEADLDQEWGWFGSEDAEFEAEMRERTVLVADSIRELRDGEPGIDLLDNEMIDEGFATDSPTYEDQQDTEPAASGATQQPMTQDRTYTGGQSQGQPAQQDQNPATQVQQQDQQDTAAQSERHDQAEGAGQRAAAARSAARANQITDFGTIADARGHQHVGDRVHLDDVTIQRAAGNGYWAGTDGQRVYVLPADQETAFSAGDTVNVQGTVLQMPHNVRESIGDVERNEDVYIYADSVEIRP